MEENFIIPISPVKSVEELGNLQKTAKVDGAEGLSSFKNMVQELFADTSDALKEREEQQYLLATGQTNNPHLAVIAAAKAQLSVDMLVQLRNKSLEAYNELIRMSV